MDTHQLENSMNTSRPETGEPAPQKPMIIIDVDKDKMGADIILKRSAAETLNPTREDIEAEVANKGIYSGVIDEVITQLCSCPVFSEPMRIARGKMPETGSDGFLNYLIKTKKELKPTIRPNGTVNYRDIGFIENVKKDQPLCEFHKGQKGSDGYDVTGKVLEGFFGKDPIAPLGKNTKHDEETGMIISLVDGHAEVDSRGVIDIFDVLNIPKNVDNSTGDIFFSGDVIVNGDVASNFTIKTRGNVTVNGTVSGAKIIADGDITVRAGINGMNTALIEAGGSVKSSFIQNAKLFVQGDIFADYILHSMIECGGSLELDGNRRILVGGKTTIAKALKLKTIGTDSHVPTHVTMVGRGLSLSKKLIEVTKEIKALDSELVTTIQTLNWCGELIKKDKLKPFQENAFEAAKVRLKQIPVEREQKLEMLKEIQEGINCIIPEETYIRCTGRIHSGVKIVFGMETMNVNASFENSRLYLDQDKIVVASG